MSIFSNSFCLLLACLMLLSISSAQCESTFKNPPFEKIYVAPQEILTTPFASYYRTPGGTYEPIHTISSDYFGTYIIKVSRECPKCGHTHHGKNTAYADYSCCLDEYFYHYSP